MFESIQSSCPCAKTPQSWLTQFDPPTLKGLTQLHGEVRAGIHVVRLAKGSSRSEGDHSAAGGDHA